MLENVYLSVFRVQPWKPTPTSNLLDGTVGPLRAGGLLVNRQPEVTLVLWAEVQGSVVLLCSSVLPRRDIHD